jgi:DNA-binding HxlR family transcriptional regulator
VSPLLKVVCRPWAPEVLVALRRPCHYNRLLALVEGISDRTLTRRLEDLRGAGLVARDVTLDRPLRVTYQLTEAGARVAGTIHPLTLLEAVG